MTKKNLILLLSVIFLTSVVSYSQDFRWMDKYNTKEYSNDGEGNAVNFLAITINSIADGKFESASYMASRCILSNPRNAACYMFRGIASWQLNENASALADLIKVTEIESAAKNDNDLRRIRGDVYRQLGKFKEAETEYDASLKLKPSEKRVLLNRGIAKLKQDKFDEALSDLNKVIALDPKNLDAYFFQGASYSGKKQFDLAIKSYTKAIELSPDEWELYYQRGDNYNQSGKKDLAIADFRKALSLDADNVQAKEALTKMGVQP